MSARPDLPNLRLSRDQVPERALVVGDPGRAERAAELLQGSRRLAANREYASFAGTVGGRPILVCSHGVGAAGAAICFEELARGGARTIVRAGTCGSLRDEIGDGELVIATAAVRDEGVTPRLAPLSVPAVADLELTGALQRAAAERGRAARGGIVLSTDTFYPSEIYPVDWALWQRCGVVAVEMEVAALFLLAALHRIRAAAILAVDGNPTRAAADMSEYDPARPVVERGIAAMLEIALAALAAS